VYTMALLITAPSRTRRRGGRYFPLQPAHHSILPAGRNTGRPRLPGRYAHQLLRRRLPPRPV
jgi:hypothetical protein